MSLGRSGGRAQVPPLTPLREEVKMERLRSKLRDERRKLFTNGMGFGTIGGGPCGYGGVNLRVLNEIEGALVDKVRILIERVQYLEDRITELQIQTGALSRESSIIVDHLDPEPYFGEDGDESPL